MQAIPTCPRNAMHVQHIAVSSCDFVTLQRVASNHDDVCSTRDFCIRQGNRGFRRSWSRATKGFNTCSWCKCPELSWKVFKSSNLDAFLSSAENTETQHSYTYTCIYVCMYASLSPWYLMRLHCYAGNSPGWTMSVSISVFTSREMVRNVLRKPNLKAIARDLTISL